MSHRDTWLRTFDRHMTERRYADAADLAYSRSTLDPALVWRALWSKMAADAHRAARTALPESDACPTTGTVYGTLS